MLNPRFEFHELGVREFQPFRRETVEFGCNEVIVEFSSRQLLLDEITLINVVFVDFEMMSHANMSVPIVNKCTIGCHREH